MTAAQGCLFQCAREPVDDALGVCGPEHTVETLRVPVAGTSRGYALIELAQHVDDRWMWGLAYETTWGGGGYRVGPKWGRWAPDRLSALREALAEVRARPWRIPPSAIDALAAAGRVAE